MEKKLLIQRLMETFLSEFDQRLHSMSRDLLALEASEPGSPEREGRLQALIRNAHALKGAARAVEVELIEEVCQRFEEILTGLQKTPALLDEDLFPLLFSVLDGLAEVGKLIGSGDSIEGSLLAGVSMEMDLFIKTCINTPRSTGSDTKKLDTVLPDSVAAKATPRAEIVSASDPPSAAENPSPSASQDKLGILLSRSTELSGARLRLRATADRLTALSSAVSVLQAELDKLRQSFLEDWSLLDCAGAALDEQVRQIRTWLVTEAKRKRCILVVDDSMTTRSLARNVLESAGYLVELASDGMQGWERIQGGGIDLVLCDVDMPLMNGYELIRMIRSSNRYRSLPVILITNLDDARSKERGTAAGANAYLTKGNLDLDMLLSLLEQIPS